MSCPFLIPYTAWPLPLPLHSMAPSPPPKYTAYSSFASPYTAWVASVHLSAGVHHLNWPQVQYHPANRT